MEPRALVLGLHMEGANNKDGVDAKLQGALEGVRPS